MRAPAVQAGIARAKGRTTRAILEWKGIGPIHFISVYLETGGKLTNNNLQILADISSELAKTGALFWIGGDFQIDSSWLEDIGWLRTVHGRLRAGSKHIGTCTMASPATNIDYHIVHKKLSHMVSEAQIDLGQNYPHIGLSGRASN